MFTADEQTFGARPRVSSNSFANGSNQNSGNVLSDTPTTRVAAPPGGRSTFSLGWDSSSAPEQPHARGRNGYEGHRQAPAVHAKPVHQEQASFQGRVAEPYDAPTGVPSPVRAGAALPEEVHGMRARVSSNSYACGSNQNQGNVLTGVPTTRVLRPPGGTSQVAGLLAWDDTSAEQRGVASTQQHRSGEAAFGQRPRVSSNSYACGADQNCGNVLSDTPTTRVLRPPGGGGSLNLGWG